MLSEIKYEKLPSYELGMEMGEEKGFLRGEKKGEIKTKKVIIGNLFKNNMDIKTIADIVQMSEEEIQNLLKEKK